MANQYVPDAFCTAQDAETKDKPVKKIPWWAKSPPPNQPVFFDEPPHEPTPSKEPIPFPSGPTIGEVKKWFSESESESEPTISAKEPSCNTLVAGNKELHVTFMQELTSDQYVILLRLTKKGWPLGTDKKCLKINITEEMLKYTGEGEMYPEFTSAPQVISEPEEEPVKPKDKFEDLIL